MQNNSTGNEVFSGPTGAVSIANIRFEEGNAVRLPYADGSFMERKEAGWLGLGGSTLLVGRK